MTRSLKALLTGLVAAGVLMSLVAAASAATIEASEGSITSEVRQTLTFGEGGATAACNFRLTGTLTTRAEVAELQLIQVGGVTGGTGSSECRGLASSVTLLNPAEWLIFIAYDLETNGIRLELLITRAKFLLQIPIAGSCLYEGTVVSRQLLVTNPATLRSLTFALADNNNIPKVSGGPLCPTVGRLQGTVPLSPALTIGVTLP